MQRLKVVHVGAGSFVFGPGSIAQGLLEHRAADLELVLVDPSDAARELVVGVARRMAEGLDGVTVDGAAGCDGGALDGADFVICSAAPAMVASFGHVRDAVAEHCPGHPISEFGGVHGVDCTLRSGRLVRRLAEEMRRRCPGATLLNVTNPLPRICQVAAEVGVETVGFCSVSLAAYDWLDRLHGGPGERFPFQRSRDRFDMTAGGVNHMSWIVRLQEDGRDALPATMEKICDLKSEISNLRGWEHAHQIAREVGVPIAVADDHTRDFLPPRAGDAGADHVSHGSADTRRRLADNLAAYAAGDLPWRDVGATVPWERPWDYLLARSGRSDWAEFHSLNLPNAGQVPQLPRDVYVETPAVADHSGVRPTRIDLPETAAAMCRDVIETHGHLVRAVLHDDPAAVRDALASDPTVADPAAALRACAAAAAMHADLMPAGVLDRAAAAS